MPILYSLFYVSISYRSLKLVRLLLTNPFVLLIVLFIPKVGRTTLDSRDELVLEDFSHVEKMTFPASGSTKPGFITPPHSLAHTFKFKSYSLQVFRRIRNFFGIDNAEYMMSVCGTYVRFLTYLYHFYLFSNLYSINNLYKKKMKNEK